ncbi:hypothetical protein VTL71DRAFT_7371 [Oculimacula yallundae]|uniref:Uncharacterized protein n=1 Tax=Oculimacula yallundae TaxID=86028 RepID=A0ABR4BX79_9HELO
MSAIKSHAGGALTLITLPATGKVDDDVDMADTDAPTFPENRSYSLWATSYLRGDAGR